MITEVKLCKRCGSSKLRKNGSDRGIRKYHCKVCNYYGRIPDKSAARAVKYAQVEQLLRERNSLRSITRITGVSRSTITKLLKKSNPNQLRPNNRLTGLAIKKDPK